MPDLKPTAGAADRDATYGHKRPPAQLDAGRGGPFSGHGEAEEPHGYPDGFSRHVRYLGQRLGQGFLNPGV